ncbi:MAG: hypothetical protein ACI4O5_00875 [Oscillospiraceae bacterium]
MKSKRILDALGQVDETYIEEAAPVGTPKGKKHRWVKWGALAACLCLVLCGAFLFVNRDAPSSAADANTDTGITVSADGVTIPPMEVTLAEPENVEFCWAYAFFIYQGRCYKRYEWICGDADLIGEYLGTAIGLIDVWTPKEGYVELAGNISGDFYSVKGYDPGFMLCMRESNGAIQIFINDNDLTLKYGTDLFEDRFHLSEKIEEMVFQSHKSWNQGTDELFALNSEEAVAAFVAALDQGEFMREADVPLKDGQNYLAQADLWHVSLRMNDGTTLQLRLAEGGYVHFGIYFNGICVKVDEEAFNTLIALFESGEHAAPAQPESGPYLTLEECLDDPYFGGYVPSYVPEGVQFEHATRSYVIEPKTGKLVKTEEIWLDYSSERDPDTALAEMEYSIQLAWAEDYGDCGWAGPMLDRAELTPEAIGEYISTTWGNGTPRKRSEASFGVWLSEDVMAVFYGYGLDAETSYQILMSIPE